MGTAMCPPQPCALPRHLRHTDQSRPPGTTGAIEQPSVSRRNVEGYKFIESLSMGNNNARTSSLG